MIHQTKQVALVTGASSGMGKEIAKRLMADGCRVYAAARQVEKMDDLARLGATLIQMDVSSDADMQAAAARIQREAGGVDVLVNNAGFGLYGPAEEIGMDEARYQFEVNLFGPARLTQLLLPAMRAKKSGKIINISSMGGKIYTPLGSWYHATKHALEGWSDCLRLELAPFGIDVVVIEPGLIETAFGEVVADGLLKRSGSGAYAKLVESVAAATRATYGQGSNTPPGVIADVIGEALKSRRPRTRYVAGKFARLMIAMRAWLGDRLFDKILLSQLP
ncbi:SDR family NAD(P)-dependent oxidoreductase [Pseudoduganella sp. FT55W]|uniref:SDR family NAD(P)-dependent oxidoreductase n=1 Tax=Duganella rivi TaxID=2666083 RepID=A0A7X4KCR7_9BURK|nr:oxidoreductase [Duganella rivi]MYM68604.1 SDR family NAD(P)-dependent oxidoreductase [Duganella rivi]